MFWEKGRFYFTDSTRLTSCSSGHSNHLLSIEHMALIRRKNASSIAASSIYEGAQDSPNRSTIITGQSRQSERVDYILLVTQTSPTHFR